MYLKKKRILKSWKTYWRNNGGKLPQSCERPRHPNARSTKNTWEIHHKRSSHRHIVFRLSKVKTKERRAARQKHQVTYKGKPIRLTADFSAETLQVRRDLGPIFSLLKHNNYQPRILYSVKLSIIYEGNI